MVSNKLRFLTDKIVLPIGRAVGARVSPNVVTVLGLAVMIVASVYTAAVGLLDWDRSWLWGSLLLLLLSGFLDMLDGAIAKATNQKTRFGGVLDSVMDRYADGAFITGLVFGRFLDPPSWIPAADPAAWGVLLGFAGMLGAYLTSYIRSRAEIEGVAMAGVGWIERGERVIAIGVAILVEIIVPRACVIFYVFIVLTILMHVTALQRIVHARNALRAAGDGGTPVTA